MLPHYIFYQYIHVRKPCLHEQDKKSLFNALNATITQMSIMMVGPFKKIMTERDGGSMRLGWFFSAGTEYNRKNLCMLIGVVKGIKLIQMCRWLQHSHRRTDGQTGSSRDSANEENIESILQ